MFLINNAIIHILMFSTTHIIHLLLRFIYLFLFNTIFEMALSILRHNYFKFRVHT